jgi:ferritin-like metal-binding protein YciE
VFEHLDTPEDIFDFKLGSALTMERDGLALLAELEEAANRPEIKQMFRDHAAETEQQIANIEKSFALLGLEVNDQPSPVTKGLAKEGKSALGKTDPKLADALVLSGALENEHYEIAVYEVLVPNAKARGAAEVAALLQANLDQEEAARDLIKSTLERIGTEGIAFEGATA